MASPRLLFAEGEPPEAFLRRGKNTLSILGRQNGPLSLVGTKEYIDVELPGYGAPITAYGLTSNPPKLWAGHTKFTIGAAVPYYQGSLTSILVAASTETVRNRASA